MTTMKRTLVRAACYAGVAATAALTTLAIGLPIAIAGAQGGRAGPIPVPLNLLAYLALLILAPVFASSAVCVSLAMRLGLMNSGGSTLLVQILVVLTTIPVLAWLVRLAGVGPA